MSNVPSFGSGFTWLDNAPRPDALLRFLDDFASAPVVAEIKQVATAHLALQPGERVLDVGCGTGVDLAAMAGATRPGGRVVGVDLSERAVEVASSRFAHVDDIDVRVADVGSLPFRDGSFDAVRADRVLLHVAQPDLALAEIRRVLVPGGRLVILESGSGLEGADDVLEQRAHAAIREVLWAPGEHRERYLLFLPLLLRQAGFSDVQVESGSLIRSDAKQAEAILRLEDATGDAVDAGTLSQSDAAAWLNEVQAAMAAGTVSVRIQYTCYVAR